MMIARVSWILLAVAFVGCTPPVDERASFRSGTTGPDTTGSTSAGSTAAEGTSHTGSSSAANDSSAASGESSSPGTETTVNGTGETTDEDSLTDPENTTTGGDTGGDPDDAIFDRDGDNPLKASFTYERPECNSHQWDWRSWDRCHDNGLDLYEQIATNNFSTDPVEIPCGADVCCTRATYKTYNCPTWCQARGHSGGKCSDLQIQGQQQRKGYCECIDIG
jgi:hypothetical protein